MRMALARTVHVGVISACLSLSCSASTDGGGATSGSGSGGAFGSGGAWSANGGAAGDVGNSAGGVTGAGGNASAGGGADAAGGTSAIITDAGRPPPYDPGVTFDWPETVSRGPCEPGTYEGTFTCDLDFFAGIFKTQVSGPVSFTLQPSANGEFLEIKDGTLAGTAQTTIKFNSPLAGQLDCSTNTFHADAPQGTYSDGLFITGTFSGGLDARLDRATQILTGTWDLTPSGTGTPCAGNWTATRKP